MSNSGQILIIDDNSTNRLTLYHGVQQLGHTATVAENGKLGLEMIESGSFDVILLDILMPEMDGYQVLESMKRDSRMRDLPVIVISGLDEMDSAARCIEMGAEDYLAKPFNPVLLRARLNASLEKKRYRDLERAYLQQEIMLRQSEKLATLGRLSAGMAHELNNPVAAAQRNLEQIQTAVQTIRNAQLEFSQAGLNARQIQDLDRFEQRAIKSTRQPVALDPLAWSDKERQIELVLEANEISNAWEYATALVSLNVDADQLLKDLATFEPEQLPACLQWIAGTTALHSLIAESRDGLHQITKIVSALKSYSYMDQAPVQLIDIHDGIETTLALLQSRLHQNIDVVKDYHANLPRIPAYASELNQVWTNLLENAIDALDGGGRITIRTWGDADMVNVMIGDTGCGVPEHDRQQIFDPFFTTKPPGHGAGTGLSVAHNIIVQRHGGNISLSSDTGTTYFTVSLPTTDNLSAE